MGFECKKVRLRPDGSVYWVIHHRDRSKGDDKRVVIKRDELRSLVGIGPDSTFDEAKAACEKLNARSRLDKAEQRRRVRIAACYRIGQTSKK